MNAVPISAAEPYLHDPMENPKAAADIIVNPDAVYGYSPSPTSARLKAYVDYDWTDEAVVNEMRVQREEYHKSLQELYDMIDSMRAENKSLEEIFFDETWPYGANAKLPRDGSRGNFAFSASRAYPEDLFTLPKAAC